MGKKKRNKAAKQQKIQVVEATPAPKPQRAPVKLHQIVNALSAREFKAGKTDRLHTSWGIAGNTLDQDLYQYLDAMRHRSRNLFKNNPYGRRFHTRLGHKCIGPKGVKFQARPLRPNGQIDEADARMLETAFAVQSKAPNYTATADMTRAEAEHVMLQNLSQDGAFLAKIIRGYDNRTGWTLQFLDVDRIDMRLTRVERNGNLTVMGIEKNSFGRVVAYHLLKRHPSPSMFESMAQASNPQDRERVPASDVIHKFVKIGSEQTHGIPWPHAAMLTLEDLGGHREAAIIAARFGANQMAWIKDSSGREYTGDDEDEDGNALIHAEPGQLGQLGPDQEIVDWSPPYPNDVFAPFDTAILQGIAMGLNSTHHGLSGDLSGVNYSSARAGDRDEKDVLVDIQQIIVEINNRIYEDWLQYQIDTGRMGVPPRLFDKLNAAVWSPKRWEEIDPQKTAQANDINLKNGIDTEWRIITEQRGLDPEDVVLEKKAWIDLHKKHEVPLPEGYQTVVTPATVAESEAE